MADIINPSTPFFKWKMAIVTKSADDWTKWNCDETYERSLFIGIHDDLEKPYAALYIIYKGTVQPAAGNAILADLLALQTTVNNAVQELQALIDQVNSTSASMQELWQKVNALVAEMEDKLEDMQIQIGKAKAWAEGTDAEVTPMGGIHSAKTWAGIAKQAADQATGAAFPILEEGDQGKALVVNDTADGYVVSTISSRGGFGSANLSTDVFEGSFTFYEGIDRDLAVPSGTEGIVIDGYDADGAPVVSNVSMVTKYSFRARNTDTDKGFWYLTDTDDGTVMPSWARPQYTFIGAKPTDGSYGYWLDTANGKFWRIGSMGQLYKASAPIGYMGENGYYMPFDGFSIAQNASGISYVLRHPKNIIQFPWGSGRAGEYAHGTDIPACFIYGTWKLAYALPADITSYAYILLRSSLMKGAEDIIGSNQLGFDAYSNLYKGITTATQDRPIMYLGCWGDTSVFPQVVDCTGGSLPVINFVRKVQNWQSSTASDFTPWQTIELVRDGKPTLGQYQRALYGKVFFDIDSEKYYRAQYASVGEGCVPYNTPFTNTTYWKDITPPKTDKTNNWTAEQDFQDAWFQGVVTLSSHVDASEAASVFVPDFRYPTSSPVSPLEAVNRKMLNDTLASKEDLNVGVSLSEPSTTSPFAGVIETVGTSVTLDNATGIASGFDASSYLKFVAPSTEAYGFDFIIRVKTTDAGLNPLLAYDTADGTAAVTDMGLNAGKPYTYQNVQMNLATTNTVNDGEWAWVRFKKSSSSTDGYVLKDPSGQYTLANLPDLAQWDKAPDGGSLVLVGNKVLCIGKNFRETSSSFNGSIDLYNTKLTVGDAVYYDGSTLVQTAYETQGIHQQSACLVNPSILVRRFESSGKTYMELDGTFSGTVAADNTISIDAKAYSFKGTLISLQAMLLGTGTVTVNYNSTTAADLENGTITLRTSISAGEAFSVSLHCVIAQGA